MAMTTLELPGFKKQASGKVREVFDLGDDLLMVATDRISAFDHVFAEPIPGKGEVLNRLSAFWFQRLDFVPSHFVAAEFALFPEELAPFAKELAGRSMIVRKTHPLPVECVVRGYLAGAAWQEYQRSGSVGGQPLADGLKLGDRLPEPMFTPTTKTTEGHDQPLTWEQFRRLVGRELAMQTREYSVELYKHGRAYAANVGIIIADSKFEFGMLEDELVLIDECLTPDSSRFWPAETWQPGHNPPSFDKQYLRDYLESIGWNKEPPVPKLPKEVVKQTAARYQEALGRLALGTRGRVAQG